MTESTDVGRIVAWYFDRVYRRWEGPGVVPFYCDAAFVGSFAVPCDALARGDSDALFQLFVTLAMYQARRDWLIMAQQRVLAPEDAAMLCSAHRLEEAVNATACELLRGSAETFDRDCDVYLDAGQVDCLQRPGLACPVKQASRLLRRMGDLGKLPVSAWLHLRKGDALQLEMEAVVADESEPARRADRMVKFVARVFRVGRKLATLFVSTLSTPALAPALAPWSPAVSGCDLIVLDTNVAKVVDALRGPRAAATPGSRIGWLRREGASIDLRPYGSGLPVHSVRLVQQAMYWFGSASNRIVRDDPCTGSIEAPCGSCVPRACPFGRLVRNRVATTDEPVD